MRSLGNIVILFAAGAAVLLAGCASDPEQALVGKWKGDMSGVGAAIRSIKIKSENPNAETGQIMAAARAQGMIELTLKSDKTFKVNLATTALGGTWAFDKTANVVELLVNIPFTTPAPEGEKAWLPQPHLWLGIFDPSQPTLQLFMGDHEAYKAAEAAAPGRLPGMVLRKKG
jgi:hypothetical protein